LGLFTLRVVPTTAGRRRVEVAVIDEAMKTRPGTRLEQAQADGQMQTFWQDAPDDAMQRFWRS